MQLPSLEIKGIPRNDNASHHRVCEQINKAQFGIDNRCSIGVINNFGDCTEECEPLGMSD